MSLNDARAASGTGPLESPAGAALARRGRRFFRPLRFLIRLRVFFFPGVVGVASAAAAAAAAAVGATASPSSSMAANSVPTAPSLNALRPKSENVNRLSALRRPRPRAAAPARFPSGRGDGPGVRIHQRDASLHVARPEPGASLALPDTRHLHVFVARGGIELDGHELSEGDAARLTDHEPTKVSTIEPDTEILVWATA